MSSGSSKYFVASVMCTEAELPLVQQTLQTFPQLRGAITHDQGKARYCLDLNEISAEDAKILIEHVRNTIDLVLMQLRNGK